MFKNLRLGVKIGLGYALVCVIFAATVGLTIFNVINTNAQVARVSSVRVPTMENALTLLNGINHSLAALRGYMLLGNEKFKEERAKAWEEEISSSAEKLKDLSAAWTNVQNRERFKKAEELIEHFSKAQDEIEAIARTTDNLPAMKALNNEAVPANEQMISTITKIIDHELEFNGDVKRAKSMLDTMTATRYTTGLALANIQSYLQSGDEAALKKYEDIWARNTKRVGELTTKSVDFTPEQHAALTAFMDARKSFENACQRIISLRHGDNWNIANHLLATKAAPTAFALKTTLGEMIESQRTLMASDIGHLNEQAKYLLVMLWSLLAIGIALSVVIAVVLAMVITRPINKVIGRLKDSASEVAAASGQLSGSSQQLSEMANEAAGSIEETSSSLEELSGIVESNADNAERSDGISDSVREVTSRGNIAMQNLVKSMAEIQESNSQIQQMVNVISEIGEKTAIINEIVFQTKLLSFNASVEAERAGEHGRGFAVVAQEVGNLAQMSGKAALDIGAIVKASVEQAKVITEENKKKVTAGNALVAETAKVLTDIEGKATEAAKAAKQIVTSSREQAEGIKQINTAIVTLDKTTQDNASTAEEAASAAEELSAQAETLNGVIGDLMAIVNGIRGNHIMTEMAPKPKATARPAAKGVKPNKGNQGKIIRLRQEKPATAAQGLSEAPAVKAAVGGDVGPTQDQDDAWEKL